LPSATSAWSPTSKITKAIAFHGPLDAAQRQRLLEIAERCPVQRTLQREVKIEQILLPAT